MTPTEGQTTTSAAILRMRLLHRLQAVIAFDRVTLDDPRNPPNTLASAFGALNAANAKYMRTLLSRAGAKTP